MRRLAAARAAASANSTRLPRERVMTCRSSVSAVRSKLRPTVRLPAAHAASIAAGLFGRLAGFLPIIRIM
jgi:hypothetical protein